MADDVQVKFGAQIDGLVQGINEAKEQLESITQPISGIVDAFKGLGEAAVAALAIDRVAEFSERYADLGEQIERTSQILGISTDQVQQLSFAIRMGGGDAETATLTMGIFEKNIAEAASGSGTAATAFQNMGISIKDAEGNTRSAVDVLKDVADVLSQVTDANIRAEYGRALLGRGYQNLLPVLLEGREGFDKLNAMLDQTNSKLSNDQVKALDESAKKTKELSASWEGLLIELGADTAWTKAKQDAIELTQGMTGLAKSIGQATHELGEFLGLAEEKPEPTALNEFTAAAARFRVAMAQANGTGGQPYGPNLPAGLKLPSLGKEKGDGKADDSDTQIALDDIKTQEQIAKIGLQTQKDILEEEVAAKKLTKAQEYAELEEYLQLEYKAETDALDKKAALYDDDEVKYRETLNQKKILNAQFEQAMQRLATQGALAQVQSAKKIGDQYRQVASVIERSFDGALQGVLQGTQTWQQAMGKMFSDLATSAVEAIAKIIAEWLVFEVVTEGQGTWGDFMALEKPGGGCVGSLIGLDVGAWNVPRDMPAYLHAGEMVVPQNFASGLRSGGGIDGGGGGGGGNVTINVNAIDTQTGAQFLKANAGVIAQAVSGQIRNFNSSLSRAAG